MSPISGWAQQASHTAGCTHPGVTTVQVRVLKYECNSIELRAHAERGALSEQRLHD